MSPSQGDFLVGLTCGDLMFESPPPPSLPVGVVDAVDDAVLGAGGGVGAEVGVPLVAGVAVGGRARLVGPPPVRVQDYEAVLEIDGGWTS